VEVGVEGAGIGAAKPNQSEGVDVEAPTDLLAFRWPEFRDGWRLTADALNEVPAATRRLQWLHNRTLHDWGVADGCGVTATPDRRAVEVAGGYALDAQGWEVIVPARQQLAVPATVVPLGPSAPRTFWVTASYTEANRPRNPVADCRPETVPLVNQPGAAVRWRDPLADADADRLRPGLDVILATVTIEQGLVTEVTATGRRSAVPGQRPYIHAGREPVRAGRWVSAERWPSDTDAVGVKLQINTTAGGFVTPPFYLLTVEVASDAGKDVVKQLGQPLVLNATNESVTVLFPRKSRPPRPPDSDRRCRLIDWLFGPTPAAAEAGAAAAADQTILFTIGWVGIEF
jgi:hypothetical protein